MFQTQIPFLLAQQHVQIQCLTQKLTHQLQTILHSFQLKNNLLYFYSFVKQPRLQRELKQENIPTDKRIKVGGMVQKDSVERNLSKISFVITDYENSIKVVYDGIVPDLFKEDSGVVVLGYQKNQMIYAEEVLAKHDENYMPPNIAIQK